MLLYDDVVGQDRAVAQLQAAAKHPVHAYLLLGPPGVGKEAAARSFAAALLCPDGACGQCEVCLRVLASSHPDVTLVEREGASIRVGDARDIAVAASRSPVEGARKVLVLTDFHLVEEAAPALLKTIEEPPPTTVFVILAEHVPPELVTIASRCVRIDFGPLAVERLVGVLVAEGVEPTVAAEVATASAGRLDRARLLAHDPGFAARLAAWRDAPDRLDGSGAAVASLADELLATIETVLEPLKDQQAAELTALDERAKAYGDRGPNRKDIDSRHRREQRRVRADELRSGLAVLSATYRDRLVGDAPVRGARGSVDALAAIRDATEALIRNPNEVLLLQRLLLRLSKASGALAY